VITVAVYDTKPYDRLYLERASQETSHVKWKFFDFHLNDKTAVTAEGAQAVCVFVNDKIDAPCLQILSRLGVRLIALRCAGFNNIDLAAAKSFNIAVTRVPAYSPHAVAEHTFGLLLCLNRKIHRAYHRVRDQNFSLNGLLGFDIIGKTIGIIGTGKIGKATAQIAKGFEAKVIAYDTNPSLEWAVKAGIQYTDLPTLLAQSDIISLHVPLVPDTYHMIDAAAIQQMKQGVIIINTSRGKVIETQALIQGLKSGQIGSVALDVYEEEESIFFEDLSDKILLDDELSRLLTFPNVLITAHQAFFTHESLREIAKVTSENVLRLERKEFLPGSLLTELE
jgi:D-lactate dehydrogenase